MKLRECCIVIINMFYSIFPAKLGGARYTKMFHIDVGRNNARNADSGGLVMENEEFSFVRCFVVVAVSRRRDREIYSAAQAE
jgi:hypothetical protein